MHHLGSPWTAVHFHKSGLHGPALNLPHPLRGRRRGMSCPPPTPHVYDCLRHRKDSDQAKRLLPPLDLPDKHRAGAGGGLSRSWDSRKGHGGEHPGREAESQMGLQVLTRSCPFQSPRTIWSQSQSVQSLSRVQLFATLGLQHARPPCPSPTPGVYPNSSPLSW